MSEPIPCGQLASWRSRPHRRPGTETRGRAHARGRGSGCTSTTRAPCCARGTRRRRRDGRGLPGHPSSRGPRGGSRGSGRASGRGGKRGRARAGTWGSRSSMCRARPWARASSGCAGSGRRGGESVAAARRRCTCCLSLPSSARMMRRRGRGSTWVGWSVHVYTIVKGGRREHTSSSCEDCVRREWTAGAWGES